MKKYPILRRLMCLSLSVAMLFSTHVAVFALESGGGSIRQETKSNTEKVNTEDTKESNKKQSNTNSEDISTNLNNTQSNSEEVSSNKENSKTEDLKKEDNQKDLCTDEKLQENADSEDDSKDAKKAADKTFNIKKGDFYISAFVPAGAFDLDVEFKADQVKLSQSERELVNKAVDSEEMENYYAFDLRFEADGEEIEPREGSSVKVSIESSLIETDAVVHIKDDKTAETIESEITQDRVSFETDSFSTFVFTSLIEEASNTSKFYNNILYGSAELLDRDYSFIKRTDEENGANKGRWAFRLYEMNDKGNPAYEIAPRDSYKCYQYKSDYGNPFTFRFTAPKNYYIKDVSVYAYNEAVKLVIPKKEDSDEEKKLQSREYNANNFHLTQPIQTVPVGKSECQVNLNLRRMAGGEDRTVNAVVVNLEPIPSILTGTNKYITGATFVNYRNGLFYGKSGQENKTFGEHFAFGSGQTTDYISNHCRDGQVYQGLASNVLKDGVFRLAKDNGEPFFPDYGSYSYDKWADQFWWYTDRYPYIEEYYPDANVRFDLDTEGYWTLDSSLHKYTANYHDGKYYIDPVAGTQFRPFKERPYKDNSNHNENHFGMILPITFSVGEDGLTEDGKETIFKFFGDDDVFVYVDGRLVLDLGGVHNAVHGLINFKTGEITIQGTKKNEMTSSLAGDDSCYAINEYGVKAKGIGTTNLYELIPENDVRALSKKDHVLTVVYFERGAHDSNCKISYNFTKTETRTVDFKGLKVDENQKGLANAEFTLYTDAECTNVASMGIGIPAVATSDNGGTIQFTGLSAGSIPKNQTSVTKTYYMKETKAPDEYNTPMEALWRLELTANSDGSQSQKLYALNTQAQALSFDKSWRSVYSDKSNVKAIKNNPTKYAKTLTISKKVEYGTNRLIDKDARYLFQVEQAVDGVYSVLSNHTYKVGNGTYSTDENGVFNILAGETAIFENLMETQYRVTEIAVWSNNGYSLGNYDTKIAIDGDFDNSVFYSHKDNNKRYVLINYGQAETKKDVEYHNSLVKLFDWQLIKISKTSGMSLAGAEFTLASKEKGSTDKYYGKSDADGLVMWYRSVSDRDKNKNPIEVSVGKYTLSETKAPDGYAKSEDVWQITIDRENGVSAYINKKGDLDSVSTYEEKTLENGAVLRTVKFSFENEVAYTLPATGGSGIHLYTIGGVLLILVATLLLYKEKKKSII